MAFYVLDENNNKVEALDREGVLNAIEEAIRSGGLANLVADAGFITKLKCCVSGSTNKMGFITQAKYNELKAADLLENNTLYYIYDDTSIDNIEKELQDINYYIKGYVAIPKAVDAETARLAYQLNLKDIKLNYGYYVEGYISDYPYYNMAKGIYSFSINGSTINSSSLYVGDKQQVNVTETITAIFDLKDTTKAQAFTCGKYQFIYLPNGGYVNHSTYGKITYPSNSLVLLDSNYTSDLVASGKLTLLSAY